VPRSGRWQSFDHAYDIITYLTYLFDSYKKLLENIKVDCIFNLILSINEELIKMKAQIKNGAILLPKKIIERVHLPKNGECEVITENDEIIITQKNPLPVPCDIINDIKNSKTVNSIDKMIDDELVEDR